ncbi:MAG TPA: hypothetical protein VMW56_16305 [Candidatus Margulisiibacteriota bacterium]|nr:hypothetical protein [Candidatus Margulisiibacteriota bacterium]
MARLDFCQGNATARARLLALMLLLTAAGCTPLVVVPGPGKTQSELAQDRDECFRESKHRSWGFTANSGNPGGWAAERINEDQYYDCITARGHRVLRPDKPASSMSQL